MSLVPSTPDQSPRRKRASVISVVDSLLAGMEAAYLQVERMQFSKVKLLPAEFGLLEHLGNLRDLIMGMLQDGGSGRQMLASVFGGDCFRVARLRAVLETTRFSEKNAADKRIQMCDDACSSLERVLDDSGLGWELGLARYRTKQDLRRRRASTVGENGTQRLSQVAVNLSDSMRFFAQEEEENATLAPIGPFASSSAQQDAGPSQIPMMGQPVENGYPTGWGMHTVFTQSENDATAVSPAIKELPATQSAPSCPPRDSSREHILEQNIVPGGFGFESFGIDEPRRWVESGKDSHMMPQGVAEQRFLHANLVQLPTPVMSSVAAENAIHQTNPLPPLVTVSVEETIHHEKLLQLPSLVTDSAAAVDAVRRAKPPQFTLSAAEPYVIEEATDQTNPLQPPSTVIESFVAEEAVHVVSSLEHPSPMPDVHENHLKREDIQRKRQDHPPEFYEPAADVMLAELQASNLTVSGFRDNTISDWASAPCSWASNSAWAAWANDEPIECQAPAEERRSREPSSGKRAVHFSESNQNEPDREERPSLRARAFTFSASKEPSQLEAFWAFEPCFEPLSDTMMNEIRKVGDMRKCWKSRSNRLTVQFAPEPEEIEIASSAVPSFGSPIEYPHTSDSEPAFADSSEESGSETYQDPDAIRAENTTGKPIVRLSLFEDPSVDDCPVSEEYIQGPRESGQHISANQQAHSSSSSPGVGNRDVPNVAEAPIAPVKPCDGWARVSPSSVSVNAQRIFAYYSGPVAMSEGLGLSLSKFRNFLRDAGLLALDEELQTLVPSSPFSAPPLTKAEADVIHIHATGETGEHQQLPRIPTVEHFVSALQSIAVRCFPDRYLARGDIRHAFATFCEKVLAPLEEKLPGGRSVTDAISLLVEDDIATLIRRNEGALGKVFDFYSIGRNSPEPYRRGLWTATILSRWAAKAKITLLASHQVLHTLFSACTCYEANHRRGAEAYNLSFHGFILLIITIAQHVSRSTRRPPKELVISLLRRATEDTNGGASVPFRSVKPPQRNTRSSSPSRRPPAGTPQRRKYLWK